MRRAERSDGFQTFEPTDAVIGVDDEVAWSKTCRLGDDVGRPLGLAARAHQPVP